MTIVEIHCNGLAVDFRHRLKIVCMELHIRCIASCNAPFHTISKPCLIYGKMSCYFL